MSEAPRLKFLLNLRELALFPTLLTFLRFAATFLAKAAVTFPCCHCQITSSGLFDADFSDLFQISQPFETFKNSILFQGGHAIIDSLMADCFNF